MFKRQIISNLKDWKESVPHKPLVLRGARQVGKTTLVEQFSSEFENYLYFNLELISDRTLLESDIPLPVDAIAVCPEEQTSGTR